jgi:hypothetical protein
MDNLIRLLSCPDCGKNLNFVPKNRAASHNRNLPLLWFSLHCQLKLTGSMGHVQMATENEAKRDYHTCHTLFIGFPATIPKCRTGNGMHCFDISHLMSPKDMKDRPLISEPHAEEPCCRRRSDRRCILLYRHQCTILPWRIKFYRVFFSKFNARFCHGEQNSKFVLSKFVPKNPAQLLFLMIEVHGSFCIFSASLQDVRLLRILISMLSSRFQYGIPMHLPLQQLFIHVVKTLRCRGKFRYWWRLCGIVMKFRNVFQNLIMRPYFSERSEI